MLKGEKLSHYYENNDRYLFEDINLHIKRGEIVSLVGKSGLGKSTIVKILGGLKKPKSGNVTLDDTIVRQPDAPISIVFQKYQEAVFPWLNAKKNIYLGLNGKKTSESLQRIHEIIQLLRLDNHIQKYPYQLSGGQNQRVQIARAIITGAEFILFDEPTSSLDIEFRMLLQEKLIEMSTKFKLGIFLVTHNLDDVTYLSDRVYILRCNEQSNKNEITELQGKNFKSTAFHEAKATIEYQNLHNLILNNL